MASGLGWLLPRGQGPGFWEQTPRLRGLFLSLMSELGACLEVYLSC